MGEWVGVYCVRTCVYAGLPLPFTRPDASPCRLCASSPFVSYLHLHFHLHIHLPRCSRQAGKLAVTHVDAAPGVLGWEALVGIPPECLSAMTLG